MAGQFASNAGVVKWRKDTDTARYLVRATVPAGDGEVVEKWRRYNEFAAMHKALGSAGLPPLPPKTLFGVKSEAELERRRKALNELVVRVTSRSGASQLEFLRFLFGNDADVQRVRQAQQRAQADSRSPRLGGGGGHPEQPRDGLETPVPASSCGEGVGIGASPTASPRQDAPPAAPQEEPDPTQELWTIVASACRFFVDAHSFEPIDGFQESDGEADWSEAEAAGVAAGVADIPSMGTGLCPVPAVDSAFVSAALRGFIPPPPPVDGLEGLSVAVSAALQESDGDCAAVCGKVVSQFELQHWEELVNSTEGGAAEGEGNSPQQSPECPEPEPTTTDA
eukprot:Hpha_TRINITY_DN3771_c0_g1::TRINITY_DN3771_c0_g1_i1::g.23814::m.23814